MHGRQVAAVFSSVLLWVRLLRRLLARLVKFPVQRLQQALLRLLQPQFRVRVRFPTNNQRVFVQPPIRNGFISG